MNMRLPWATAEEECRRRRPRVSLRRRLLATQQQAVDKMDELLREKK